MEEGRREAPPIPTPDPPPNPAGDAGKEGVEHHQKMREPSNVKKTEYQLITDLNALRKFKPLCHCLHHNLWKAVRRL